MKKKISVEQPLFDVAEYTIDAAKKVMSGTTCRSCRHCIKDGGNSYCQMYQSRRTSTGLLRVRTENPACIYYYKNS